MPKVLLVEIQETTSNARKEIMQKDKQKDGILEKLWKIYVFSVLINLRVKRLVIFKTTEPACIKKLIHFPAALEMVLY